MIRVGVIGYGYWGPRVARNFHDLESCELASICDKRPDVARRAKQAYPNAQVTSDVHEAITSPDIDAVAVVTPVWTHFELAKAALENGKHIFVEKPFTSTAAQAEELIDLADRKHLQIMVDHTFLFTGAVKKMRELIDDGTLGQLYYYDSTRVNLGLFQHDVNVIWDLAPHDLSIMDYLIQRKPEALVATGQVHLNGFEDLAYLTIYFPDRMIAHINVNWLSPVKGALHSDRRREKDAGVERSGSGREDQGLRQGRKDQERAEHFRLAGELPFGRHVVAEGGTGRGSGDGSEILHRVRLEKPEAIQ